MMMKTEFHTMPGLLIYAEQEQVSGKGEDAFSYSFTRQDHGYIAVFDGCGGMGSKKYPMLNDRTGARIASRLAGFVVDQFYEKGGFCDFSNASELLRKALINTFSETKAALAARKSGIMIGGDMFKELPTTLSLIASRLNEQRELETAFIWAGDSRGYFLDKKGICQVTADDLETAEDAFSNLRSDGKLSNVVNGDTPFILHEKRWVFREPVLLITATDGSFGYFKTPMEFEYTILCAMQQAADVHQWKTALGEAIKKTAGDDFSILISAFGFLDFSACKDYFAQRFRYLRRRFVPNADYVPEEELQALWDEYRKDYYRW